MSTMLIQSDTLTDIADAIRSKLGVVTTYKPSEMPDAIESISGGGAATSPIDFAVPLFVLFQHDPADSVYTASVNERVLVMNTMMIHEAGTTHDSDATITTTGTVVKSLYLTTNYGVDYNRDSTTRISLIDLEAGDTVTMSNTSRTRNVSKHRIIWKADRVDDIDNVLYDTVVDSSAYNTREFEYSNSDMYMTYLNQVSAANNDLSATIDTVRGRVLDSYNASTTNNRIAAVIVQNPSDLICTTNAANNYTSKLFEIMRIIPKGGLGTKTIVENGTYNASSDDLDGYSQVIVNVPGGVTSTEAVKVWTKDTSGTYAALYIQHGHYNGTDFTPDDTAEILNYQDAREVDTDYYGLISIRYNSSATQWAVKSLINGLQVGQGTYNQNETIEQWSYSVEVTMIGSRPSTGNIIYGSGTPSSSQGSDGDYYYRRVIEPNPGVEDWSGRQNSNTSRSGYEFTTLQACSATGVRVYNRGVAISVTAGLYSSDGTPIEEVTATVPTGWSTLWFVSNHQLQSGTTYITSADWGESGHAVYRSVYNLTPDSRITSLKGRYNAIVGNVDNDNIYGCDVLLQAATGDYYVITDQYVKTNGVWTKLV